MSAGLEADKVRSTEHSESLRAAIIGLGACALEQRGVPADRPWNNILFASAHNGIDINLQRVDQEAIEVHYENEAISSSGLRVETEADVTLHPQHPCTAVEKWTVVPVFDPFSHNPGVSESGILHGDEAAKELASIFTDISRNISVLELVAVVV